MKGCSHAKTTFHDLIDLIPTLNILSIIENAMHFVMLTNSHRL